MVLNNMDSKISNTFISFLPTFHHACKLIFLLTSFAIFTSHIFQSFLAFLPNFLWDHQINGYTVLISFMPRLHPLLHLLGHILRIAFTIILLELKLPLKEINVAFAILKIIQ